MLLAGCAAFAEPASRDGERKPPDNGAGSAGDGDPDPVPVPPSAISGEGVLTFAQASCLELTQAACAACHHRGAGFVLRPIGVPPPPPNTPTVASEECLQPMPPSKPSTGSIPPVEEPPTPDTPIDPAVEHVLTDEQAICIGLDQNVCSACHRRQGSFLLRPQGLPPHPDVGNITDVTDGCL